MMTITDQFSVTYSLQRITNKVQTDIHTHIQHIQTEPCILVLQTKKSDMQQTDLN